MATRPIFALAAIAVILTAAGGWFMLGRTPEVPSEPSAGSTQAPAKAIPTNAERLTLQAAADAACVCARRTGEYSGSGGCWAEFERSIARYEYSTESTMCMEESTTSVCFGPFDSRDYHESCILKHRAYGACSAEEELVRARESEDGGCG